MIGPKPKPCGTPKRTSPCDEILSLKICTKIGNDHFSEVQYDNIQIVALFEKPTQFNFNKACWKSTVSNAFE